MIKHSPGVRRLCICVAAQHARLLSQVCHTWGSGTLYTEYSDPDGVELGFASPGVDEASLVTDLISALQAASAEVAGGTAGPSLPALVVFHVGITRVEGDQLGGSAVVRVRELLGELTSVSTAGAMLIVGMSAGLFEDIGLECGFGADWLPLASAKAWYRPFGIGYPGGPVLGLLAYD